MFRHKGKHRTLKQNLKLASLLSFVAGMVNVSGFFAISTLTTHVTGHFAYIAEELVNNRLSNALIFLLYILSFFAGAFFSSLSVEFVVKRRNRYMYFIPVLLEMIILALIASLSSLQLSLYPTIIASCLLFSMGMQNALVTTISNSVVRTTHLTGLFTDLGIETAQLFFYTEPVQLRRLRSIIKLRLVIIFFFFAGCLVAGYGYHIFGISVLYLAVLCLAMGLVSESVRSQIVFMKRKLFK